MEGQDFRAIQVQAHRNSVQKGFYLEPVEDGTRIALMHSELSELLETFREGTSQSPSAKIGRPDLHPGGHVGFTNAEEELADVVLRAMDFAQFKGMDLWGAIVAKHAYNCGRPYMHGKKF